MKKKIIILTILLIFLLIGIQIYKLSIKEYKLKYQVNNYKIEEYYQKEKKENYLFQIKKDKLNYFFTENLKLRKKQIIEIKSFKKNNLNCIIPIIRKIEEQHLYCNLENQQVSLSYLKESNNKDFQELKNKIKKYQIKYPNNYDSYIKKDNIKVYQNNIEDNHTYLLWNYKGFYKITNKEIKNIKILDYDLYDNIIATVMNQYFILFENINVTGIKKIYYYDLKKEKLKSIKVKDHISKDIYINGSMNHLLYFTDKENKREYSLDIRKEEIKEIDKNQTEYIIYKNKKETISFYEFFQNEQLFINNNYFYNYKVENSKVWKYYNKNEILLLELEDIKDFKVKDNELLIIQNGCLYSYNDKSGFRKILESNELKYNYKNIIYLGKY